VRDEEDRLYFYASTGDDSDDKHKVYRATISDSGQVTIDTTRSIIGNGLEGPANHDGGGMVIHKGQLYVGVGDTGFNASPPENHYGTCLNKPNAKILRVNLDGSIPDDNPLVGMEQVTGCESPRADFTMLPPDERIYAWGLRNPWRFWIDPETDLLWIGDVGEVTQEEITVGGKGVHHGWPFYEGTAEHGTLGGLDGCMDVVPASECVGPAHGYPREDGVSVTGGLMPPRDCGWGAYEQRYFFADFGSNMVWTLDVKEDRSGVVAGSRRPFAQLASVVSFRSGPDGAIYIVSFGNGAIVRLAPKAAPASCTGAAPSLSPSEADGGGCECSLAAPRDSGRSPWAAVLVGLSLLAIRLRAGSRRAASKQRA